MLKPRKQKRLQVVKITKSRSSRAIAANAYIGKKHVYKVDWGTMVKVAKHLREMVDAPDQDKGDYFQQKKIYRDLFRLNQMEWVLSWVPGRDTLYFMRKFPAPRRYKLSDNALDALGYFSDIGINVNKEQVSATVTARKFLRDYVLDRDVEFAYMTPTVPLLNGDALKAKMEEIALKFPNIKLVTPDAVWQLGAEGCTRTVSDMMLVSTPEAPKGTTLLDIVKGRSESGYKPVILDSLSEHPEVK
ncbi:hypothetical protein MLDJOKPK_00017 [Salmonella phage SPAsTU]|nr:hypothetical protein MLDJOKPK_00017 [Salmonella phage SPAsTU]